MLSVTKVSTTLAPHGDGDLLVALDNDDGEFESRLVRYRNLIR